MHIDSLAIHFGKDCHDATEFLFNAEFDLRVILQRLAATNKAAAVFFNGVDEIEALGHQFVTQAGAVAVGLDVGNADTAVKGARAEDRDLVVKDFDLDVAGVGVVAVNDGVEQCLAQRGQRVGKAFLALDAAVKIKGDADVRDDECHRLLDHFEQCVGELPVVDDHAGRFEAPTRADGFDRKLGHMEFGRHYSGCGYLHGAIFDFGMAATNGSLLVMVGLVLWMRGSLVSVYFEKSKSRRW